MATAGNYTPASAEQSMQEKSHTLSFTEIKSHKDLVKKYPFLKDDIAEVEHDDLGETTKTTTSIATFHDKASNSDFVFLNLSGPMFCTSHGCSVTGYVNDGHGFKSALNVLTFEPINVVTNHGKVSLVLTGPAGLAQWDLKNGQFEHSRNLDTPVAPPQQPPSPN
ncbi:MAG: hypothetical protein GC185_06260 [Alphaproteobacteria bacterium]|nr:hypothetical protein [Alphaproteobacteria bacterium]